MKEIKTKKGFKFIKINDEDIIRDIKEYFENPKIFLLKNNQIGIGKESLRRSINKSSPENKNNNIMFSLKGININSENGANLSSIPNMSQIQKTINSKEDIPQINYPLNTISFSKEVKNNEMNNSKVFNNYLLESKKENNNNTIKNNNYNINNENNKKTLFISRKGTFNNKNINCVTEDNYNGKNKKQRLSNFYENLNKDKKILLLYQKNNKLNKENTKNNEKKFSFKKKKIENETIVKKGKRPLSVNIHYQYKTSNEIIEYYLLGKNREKESKLKGTNSLIPKEVEEKTKKKYITQEKMLKENLIHSYLDKNISNYLSKRCHKKEENLLYNNIENFRIKKQLIDYLENKKNLFEKLGNNLWYVNLRRPDFLKKPRGLFINIGKEEKGIWEPIVEFPMKNVEIIKKTETPHKENNNFEKLLKEKNIYPNNLFNPNKNENIKDKAKMPNLTEINNLVIKGKNMVLLEKDNFINNDEKLYFPGHKYRVFRDPRENNLKCSNDCLYRLDYQFEGHPYKTKIGIKNTLRAKTPKTIINKNILIYKSDTDKKRKKIKKENKL